VNTDTPGPENLPPGAVPPGPASAYDPAAHPAYGSVGKPSYGPAGQPAYGPAGQPSYGPQEQPSYGPAGPHPYGGTMQPGSFGTSPWSSQVMPDPAVAESARWPVAASLRQRWAMGGAVLVVVALLGFPLGWLWSSVAPWIPVQVVGNDLYLADPEGEQIAGAEVWFMLLSFGAGILLAVIAWFALRRYRGGIIAAALAVGGSVTGWLAWRFGHNLGRGHVLAEARHAKNGAFLRFPPNLRIKTTGDVAHWHGIPYVGGDVLFVGIAALAVYLLLVLVSVSPSLGLRRRPAHAGGAPAFTTGPGTAGMSPAADRSAEGTSPAADGSAEGTSAAADGNAAGGPDADGSPAGDPGTERGPEPEKPSDQV